MGMLRQMLRASRQRAVYWAPDGFDEFGKPTWADPVEFRCRWVDTMEEVIGPDGAPITSRAQVTSDKRMAPGGLLRLGEMVDVLDAAFPENPRDDHGVFEVVSVTATPSINARETLVTAFVK